MVGLEDLCNCVVRDRLAEGKRGAIGFYLWGSHAASLWTTRVSIAVLKKLDYRAKRSRLSYLVWIEGGIEVLGSNTAGGRSLIEIKFALFNYKVLPWDR
jgi:hypothetical protein